MRLKTYWTRVTYTQVTLMRNVQREWLVLQAKQSKSPLWGSLIALILSSNSLEEPTNLQCCFPRTQSNEEALNLSLSSHSSIVPARFSNYLKRESFFTSQIVSIRFKETYKVSWTSYDMVTYATEICFLLVRINSRLFWCFTVIYASKVWM